jgi:hypothetical protein
MPQQHADSPEVIYDTLTGDSTFMALVGTTTYKTGSTELDSISIVTPGADLPAVKSTAGLEVIIHDVAKLERRDYITSPSDIVVVWKVFLLAWPPANGGTVNTACRRIMELFSGATVAEVNPTADGLGSIVQSVAFIPSDSVVLS